MGKLQLYVFFDKELREEKTLSRGTKSNHYYTYRIILKDFSSQILQNVDYQFAVDFDSILREKGLKNNTRYKHHIILSRYISAAFKKRLISGSNFNNYKLFKCKAVYTTKEVLSISDVKLMEKAREHDEIKNNPKLLRILDSFLFATYTGLRYSDIATLQPMHVRKINDITYLNKEMVKLARIERYIRLPLSILFNGRPLEILNLQPVPGRGEGYFSGNYDATRHGIGKIGKMVGIQHKINFHMSRHTFLTRIAEKSGNIFTVMQLGGISSLQTAQGYINLANMDKEMRLPGIEWD